MSNLYVKIQSDNLKKLKTATGDKVLSIDAFYGCKEDSKRAVEINLRLRSDDTFALQVEIPSIGYNNIIKLPD